MRNGLLWSGEEKQDKSNSLINKAREKNRCFVSQPNVFKWGRLLDSLDSTSLCHVSIKQTCNVTQCHPQFNFGKAYGSFHCYSTTNSSTAPLGYDDDSWILKSYLTWGSRWILVSQVHRFYSICLSGKTSIARVWKGATLDTCHLSVASPFLPLLCSWALCNSYQHFRLTCTREMCNLLQRFLSVESRAMCNLLRHFTFSQD